MKENDEFILDIKRLGINGEGIGFYNKLAIFVDDAIPGEGHNVKITKVEKNLAYAKSLEIKHKSPDRITPICKHYFECGGCQTMHIKYEKMLEYKRELIIEAIKKYTKLNPKSFEIYPTIPSDKITEYRNRSILPVKEGLDTNLHVCMIKQNTNYLTAIDTCVVQDPLINDINNQIIDIANKMHLRAYVQKYNRGLLRYISIRVNRKNEALVTLICGEKNPKIKELAKEVSKIPGVKGVYENFNLEKKAINPFGEETNHLFGEEYIIENLGDIQYKIYPTTFFQLNTLQAEKLVDTVKKISKLSRNEIVIDAYCGVGAIGLYLAKNVKTVIGIENNKDSVLAAKDNAELNKIKNAKFYQGDSINLIPKVIEDNKDVKEFTLIVDPPRTGLDKKLIECINNSSIRRIVYISCNPATLAKDLDLLSEKYNISSLTPLDLFPLTSHCESITILNIKK